MGLPRQLASGSSGSGYGPFGEKAFKRTLVGCVVLVSLGLLMLLLGSGAPRAVGTAFIVLGVVGLLTGGAGLLAERLLQRRPPPPPEVRSTNGRGPYRPDRAGIERRTRERP
jgi:hypothetical protein